MSIAVFQPYDMGNSEKELHAHAGQCPVSITPADENTYDREEVGPMFTITFEDGFKTDAFSDELKF
jgi:hypothetical protein